MAEDQRFAAERKDVVLFETDILKENVILAGQIIADLQVSLSTTDADFIVKVIDVLPVDEPAPTLVPKGTVMAGYKIIKTIFKYA